MIIVNIGIGFIVLFMSALLCAVLGHMAGKILPPTYSDGVSRPLLGAAILVGAACLSSISFLIGSIIIGFF